MNENMKIGTAILSMYSDKKQSDSIDLMLPFVKFTLQEKYTIGDIVSSSEICDYIQKTFAFEDLPIAIIDKSLNRLSKNGGCLTYNKHKYSFTQSVENEHSKLKIKRNQAMTLIDSILKKLTPYLNSKINFKTYSEDEARQFLFNFLDKYGLSTYENKLIEQSISKQEQINRIIGAFVLEEYQENSLVFNNLIELIKGVFISKAVYLQTSNETLFKARMKDAIIILDAPLLLRVLGLKSEGENRKAKEFLQIIPPQVKLHYFQQNFDELENIIRSYKNQRILGGKYTHTLEYFDEKAFSIEDIDNYYIQLEKKLRVLNVSEYTADIPMNSEYFIDEKGLAEHLKEKIPAYNNIEKALENDVTTISYIYRLRKGKKPSSIENCRAIFITNNFNLVKYANSFLNDIQTVGCVMTEIDFTILMWLKNGAKNSKIPKEILVSNALAATEEITDNFMEGVLLKIKKYQEEGLFDEENAGLILENIYLRRELVEKCNGNPEEFSIEILQSVQEKYEQEIIQKAGYNTIKLSNELEVERHKRHEAETEKTTLIDNIKADAKEVAKKGQRLTKIVSTSLIAVLFIFFGGFGIYATIVSGINGKISILGIVAILFSGFGIIDFLYSKLRFALKLSNWLGNKVYDFIYDKKTKCLRK